MDIGASFSHLHLMNNNISVEDAIYQYAALGLKHIRLGCYWSSIERYKGKYDYAVMDKLVNACKNSNVSIVMTVGMKAPRFPEYYIPPWALEKKVSPHSTISFSDDFFTACLFAFIEQTIKHFKDNRSIRYWQIENEPLDPSGPLWLKIDRDLLEKEISLVRILDSSRPLILTLWGNELKKRNTVSCITRLADIIGLDLYPKVPHKNIVGSLTFHGPDNTDTELLTSIDMIKGEGKRVWISELQAEPWIYPETCTVELIQKNIRWVKDWPIDALYLWGFEYWYQQKLKGNSQYWSTVQSIFNR